MVRYSIPSPRHRSISRCTHANYKRVPNAIFFVCHSAAFSKTVRPTSSIAIVKSSSRTRTTQHTLILFVHWPHCRTNCKTNSCVKRPRGKTDNRPNNRREGRWPLVPDVRWNFTDDKPIHVRDNAVRNRNCRVYERD